MIHHKPETASTNIDARAGRHGDVFTADFQTAGRGRLDHKWLSAPGENLMLSAVLDVGDCPPDRVATLPLVVGLAVIEGLSPLLPKGLSPQLIKLSATFGCVDRSASCDISTSVKFTVNVKKDFRDGPDLMFLNSGKVSFSIGFVYSVKF